MTVFNPNIKTLFRLNAGQFWLLLGGILFGIGAGQQNPWLVLLACLFIVICARPDVWHGMQQEKIVEWNRQ